jgi:DNA-binding beta-propeller fold protein YncE
MTPDRRRGGPVVCTRLACPREAIAVTLSSLAVALLAACGGSEGLHHRATRPRAEDDPVASTASTETASAIASATVARDPILARLGLAPVAPSSPLPGYLLVADRENNRVVMVGPDKRIVWQFPGSHGSGSGGGLVGPDDAFLTPDGRFIATNEENSDTVAVVSLSASPRVVWRYGHQGIPGSEPGYLDHPDDAYMLPGGRISVADIINCRILWLAHSRRLVRQLGSAGSCEHHPPRSLSQPNGDTPLPDGGLLVTEIGGWVDRFDRRGRLVWSIKTPSEYPSDAQLLPGGKVLIAGYNSPGEVYIIDPRIRRVIWTYGPRSGGGALDHPSLALPMPNGMFAVTDDWHNRVVIIDPATKRIVWQYGHDGRAGRSHGYLNVPDGLDLVQ